MSDIVFERTNGSHPDFVENCRLLDIELEKKMGKEVQKDYLQYNHVLDQIHHAVIAYVNGVPAGSGALKQYDEKSIELKRVFVRPEYQMHGIGTALVSQLVMYAQELGFPKMILESGIQLKEAHHIYYKPGFERIENFGPFKGMENSLCMQKMLGSKENGDQ